MPKKTIKKITLPPDPEGMNDDRASWAATAIKEFIRETKTDPEDALADLLCDLMHWADRNNENFMGQFDRAVRSYKEETMAPNYTMVNCEDCGEENLAGNPCACEREE